MQINIKGFITSKKGELYSDCRDNYSVNTSTHRFAISDGVSKSFFPGIWSELLTANYVNNHEDFVIKSQDEWLSSVTDRVSKPDVKYYTKNAFNRREPGLATFVGLQFSETEMSWSAQALGDSFLFFIPKDYKNFDEECVRLSSKLEPIEFDNFPDYFSSLGNKHKGTTKSVSDKLTHGTFYLMTDALAEWFILNKESSLDKIGLWENQTDFENFIEFERENGELGNDDSAILIIELTDDNSITLTYNNTKVSCLEKLITKQEIELQEGVKVEQKLADSPIELGSLDPIVQNDQVTSEYTLESFEVGTTLTLNCLNNTERQTPLLIRCLNYCLHKLFYFFITKGKEKVQIL
jgi:hypothetical protein